MELERFIAKVIEYTAPPAEPTLFALGGRGHYENATSDLLAFFLRPDGEHGLGPAFLHAFLECLPQTHQLQMSVQGVIVHREQAIPNGRIDLVVQGSDWCLIIENKIYHKLANSLRAYEQYALQLGKTQRPLLSILSPDGESADGWTGVSYRNFCSAARRHLAISYIDRPQSKWNLFARELILHLENELYTPTMTNDQITFIEQHPRQVEEVVRLAKQYREFLLVDLRDELARSIPGETFTTRDDRWAIRCYSDAWGGRTNIAFFQDPERKLSGFFLAVYAVAISAEHATRVSQALLGMTPSREGAWRAWKTSTGISVRQDAVRELCRIAKLLSEVLRVSAPLASPGPTPSENVT